MSSVSIVSWRSTFQTIDASPVNARVAEMRTDTFKNAVNAAWTRRTASDRIEDVPASGVPEQSGSDHLLARALPATGSDGLRRVTLRGTT